jgi:excinuclease ABC subunit C
LIHRGQVQSVAFASSTPEGASEMARQLDATFLDSPAPAVLSDVAVDSVLLVAGWFRKYPDERAKLLTKAKAEEVCGSA